MSVLVAMDGMHYGPGPDDTCLTRVFGIFAGSDGKCEAAGYRAFAEHKRKFT
jgi:hypothetical protein